MNVTEYLQKWSVSYRDDMLGNIMPFWLKHGLDLRNGGVYTCLDRDGSLIDTTKSVWFQGRLRSHAVMLIIILNRIRSGWLLQKVRLTL